jgi:hypothetical protein
MQHMTIFGRVAQSVSPYGRAVPITTPAAIAPSQYKSGLSDGALGALGSMFDEWNTEDDTEFLAQEKLLMEELNNAIKQGTYDGSKKYTGIGQQSRAGTRDPNYVTIDHIKQIQEKLKTLRANPTTSTPVNRLLEKGEDTFKNFFNLSRNDSDVFRIDEFDQGNINRKKSHEFFKNWNVFA